MAPSAFTKPAFRALGVAECFRKRNARSVIAAVSYRRDRVIDGVYLDFVTVGGLDATERIVSLVERTGRKDFNVVMVNGCVISWFNIVDVKAMFDALGVPAICVTYEESAGLREYIERYFPGDSERLKLYEKLGERELVYIRNTRSYVYVRYAGLGRDEVRRVLEATTLSGQVPEPLRVAQAVARAVHELLERDSPDLLRKPLCEARRRSEGDASLSTTS
uniref:UPF0215 protein ENM88_07990 n=1 Tax=Thermofilum pendens TaxID=2269 RepID=A0A7C3WV55_THEPE